MLHRLLSMFREINGECACLMRFFTVSGRGRGFQTWRLSSEMEKPSMSHVGPSTEQGTHAFLWQVPLACTHSFATSAYCSCGPSREQGAHIFLWQATLACTFLCFFVNCSFGPSTEQSAHAFLYGNLLWAALIVLLIVRYVALALRQRKAHTFLPILHTLSSGA